MNDDLVDSKDDIANNILTLHEYGVGGIKQRSFHRGKIKNGKLFVVLEQDKRHLFAPSKFAGYKNNTTEHLKFQKKRDGRITNTRIIKLLGDPVDKGDRGYDKIDKEYVRYCEDFDIIPSRHHRPRRYWVMRDQFNAKNIAYPDDLPHPDTIVEGMKFKTFVNRFERSEKARNACLSHHGFACCVCEFSFQERYGILGRNYIHVHHVVPLSDIGREYVVDPIEDLRPVCPNCHSMLHRTEPPLTVDQLKKRLRS